MKKRVEIIIEPIEIYEDPIGVILIKLFKKHKKLIMPQIQQGTNISYNSLQSELKRMRDGGLLTTGQKLVKLKSERQARTRTVYLWKGGSS